MSASFSPPDNPNPWCPLREEEKNLLSFLLSSHADWPRFEAAINTKKVRTMLDGDMGSVEFEGDGSRRFGGILKETGYTDIDDVLVIITLIADQSGDLYEVNFWKTDFYPLKKYPQPEYLKPVEYNQDNAQNK